MNPGWGIGPAVVKSMVHDTLDLTDEDSDGYINFVGWGKEHQSFYPPDFEHIFLTTSTSTSTL